MNVLKNPRAGAFRKQEADHRYFAGVKKDYRVHALVFFLALLWPIGQAMLLQSDPTRGTIDPNIWLLLLMGLIAFIVTVVLCWWLLQQFWLGTGLPVPSMMVSQFYTLELWQQLSFLLASFALLLLTVLGIFSAIL